MRSIQVALLLLVAAGAHAQSPKGKTKLGWEPATTYTDDTFMILGEQRIYAARTLSTTCGTPPAPGSFTFYQTVAPALATFELLNQFNGGWYYYVTSVDVFGTESVETSNIVCKGINIQGNWQPPGVGVRPRGPKNLIVLPDAT